MFNIKKQIRRLYASSLFSTLSLSGAWVAILSSRGFSLAQIGAAETVFHLVSLIFEIPSGALADVVGRKKTLLISCVMRIIANIAMIASNNFALVCVSIAFSALHYNCMSGSDDALAYDSLKSAGEESSFERYASNQLVIYRVCDGLSTLTAGLALVLGYRIAYASGIFFSLVQGFFLCGLAEIRLEAPKEKTHLAPEILGCFAKSFAFLRTEKRIASFMFANSAVGALDILLLFFLQAKLPMAHIPNWALGLALLAMQAGGVIGAKAVLLAHKMRYRSLFALSFALIALGIALEHSGLYAVMTFGGFVAALADDALQVRTNALLQQRFPSEQRATLISIESFTFSLVMIVLSPLAGVFFSHW